MKILVWALPLIHFEFRQILLSLNLFPGKIDKISDSHVRLKK